MLSKEATNTNVIVFVSTWPWLETTIYRTQGKHANHYTSDTFYDILFHCSSTNFLQYQRYTSRATLYY